MPGIDELEKLANTFGLSIALLLVGCLVLMYAVIRLYRENRMLYGRMEELLKARVQTLEALFEIHHRNRS